MPGAYAHITLVNQAKESSRLVSAGIPRPAIAAILSHFKFCELGSVSPDYPYLSMDTAQHPWADHMHYDHVGTTIAAAAKIVATLSGIEREIGFAWLMGYAAHVVADMTIHPVVERKVGPYAENKKGHRICEMHQDAYIFQRLDLGDIGLAEHLNRGISDCCGTSNPKEPDPIVLGVWQTMLQTAHPSTFGMNPPQFESWHSGFNIMVNKIAEEGNHLLPIARHLAANLGLTYPAPSRLDPQYLQNLDTPAGPLSYDQVFDKALHNVLGFWKILAQAIYLKGNEGLNELCAQEWNLDTGRQAPANGGNYVFWS